MAKFLPHKTKSTDKGSVWFYFLCEKLGQTAQCKQCSKILKTIGGFTKGLHIHLKTAHEMDLLKRNAARDDAKTSNNAESEAVP